MLCLFKSTMALFPNVSYTPHIVFKIDEESQIYEKAQSKLSFNSRRCEVGGITDTKLRSKHH